MVLFFYRLILQCVEAFLACANLDDVRDRCDENLAIAVVTGVEDLLCYSHDCLRRYCGYDDLDLNLRDELRSDPGTTIHLRVPLLQPVSIDLRYSHSRDAYGFECDLQRFEAITRGDDRYAGDRLTTRCWGCRDGDRSDLGIGCNRSRC